MNITAIDKLNSLTQGFSKLGNVFNSIWNILTTGPNSDFIIPKKNVSVAINRNTISISYATRFLSKIKINGFADYPLNDKIFPDPNEFASIVSLGLKDLEIVHNEITLTIPKDWSVIRKAIFPVSVKENLYDVVFYEIDRITPFKQEDTLYDFKVIGQDENNLILLVAAANKEKIAPYIDALKDHGITVSSISVNLSSMINLCRLICNSSNFVFLDIGKNTFSGSFFYSKNVYEFFSGSFLIDDEKSALDSILAAIMPFKDRAASEGKDLNCIILLNNSSISLKEILRMKLGIPVSVLGESDIKISVKGHPKGFSYYAISSSIEALWSKANRFNLLNMGYVEKVKKPIALTIVLLLALFSLGAFYVVQPVEIEKQRLKEIDHQIAIKKDEVKKVEAIKKNIDDISNEISMINNFKGSKPLSIVILKELTSTLPKTDWLTRFKISDTVVTIEGYAESSTRLLQKLEASKYFRKVEFLSPTFRDARLNSERFNMKMELEGIKEETKAKTDKNRINEDGE
jgi:Tfp pilus assembly protein PilN